MARRSEFSKPNASGSSPGQEGGFLKCWALLETLPHDSKGSRLNTATLTVVVVRTPTVGYQSDTSRTSVSCIAWLLNIVLSIWRFNTSPLITQYLVWLCIVLWRLVFFCRSYEEWIPFKGMDGQFCNICKYTGKRFVWYLNMSTWCGDVGPSSVSGGPQNTDWGKAALHISYTPLPPPPLVSLAAGKII